VASAAYDELHAVYRDLYPATRGAMFALSAIEARTAGDRG